MRRFYGSIALAFACHARFLSIDHCWRHSAGRWLAA